MNWILSFRKYTSSNEKRKKLTIAYSGWRAVTAEAPVVFPLEPGERAQENLGEQRRLSERSETKRV